VHICPVNAAVHGECLRNTAIQVQEARICGIVGEVQVNPDAGGILHKAAHDIHGCRLVHTPVEGNSAAGIGHRAAINIDQASFGCGSATHDQPADVIDAAIDVHDAVAASAAEAGDTGAVFTTHGDSIHRHTSSKHVIIAKGTRDIADV